VTDGDESLIDPSTGACLSRMRAVPVAGSVGVGLIAGIPIF